LYTALCNILAKLQAERAENRSDHAIGGQEQGAVAKLLMTQYRKVASSLMSYRTGERTYASYTYDHCRIE